MMTQNKKCLPIEPRPLPVINEPIVVIQPQPKPEPETEVSVRKGSKWLNFECFFDYVPLDNLPHLVRRSSNWSTYPCCRRKWLICPHQLMQLLHANKYTTKLIFAMETPRRPTKNVSFILSVKMIFRFDFTFTKSPNKKLISNAYACYEWTYASY